MKNETYVQINKPCQEDWAQMTPENQGRFCAHCNKSVIDFSLMTDNEILNHLNKSNTNLCGRFHSEQLLRPLVETQLEPKTNWRYWLASVSALFLLTNKSDGQLVTGNNDPIKTSVTPKDSLRVTMGQVIKPSGTHWLLKGTIMDISGKPLSDAYISVKGSVFATTSDSIGNFALKLNNLSDTFSIVVSHIGYERKELFINNTEPKEQIIILNENHLRLTGEVVIVKKKSIKGKNKSK